jgi:hypothetical protein
MASGSQAALLRYCNALLDETTIPKRRPALPDVHNGPTPPVSLPTAAWLTPLAPDHAKAVAGAVGHLVSHRADAVRRFTIMATAHTAPPTQSGVINARFDRSLFPGDELLGYTNDGRTGMFTGINPYV